MMRIKNKLSGLLSAYVISYAANSSATITIRDMLSLNNCIFKIGWQSYANLIAKDAKKSGFLSNALYEDSIYEVISKAIADCQELQNEFREIYKNGIVEFAGTNPESYDNCHWNAVVLYNYLAQAIHNFFGVHSIDNRDIRGRVNASWIDHIGKILNQQYSTVSDIEIKIQNAVSDIKAYVKQLKLDDYLYFFHHYVNTDMEEHNKKVLIVLSSGYTSEEIRPENCVYLKPV